MYEYNATVVYVSDGDTIDCSVNLGFEVGLIKIRFRLWGINADETTLRGGTTPEEKAKGLETKAWLKDRIEGQRVVIKTHMDKAGKYGRWLCEVIHDGVNLNDYMVEHGMAVPYMRD